MARNPSSLVLKNIDNCEILTTDPEIIISDNLKISIPDNFDPKTLKQIIQAVEAGK